MLKIVVFDGGCGGEAVAEYLAEELQIVEVIQVIDWQHAPYDRKGVRLVRQLTEEALAEYFGKVDLIVLGGYTVSTALEYLQKKHKKQKFVGMGVNYYRILKSRTYPERITVIMNGKLIKSKLCEELHDSLPFSTLAIPDSSGWEKLANKNKLSAEKLRKDLEAYFELKPKTNRELAQEKARKKNEPIAMKMAKEKYVTPSVEDNPDRRLIRSDAVLILNTNYWKIKAGIEDVFGYKARVLDFRQKLLHDVCAELGLLGVCGERSK